MNFSIEKQDAIISNTEQWNMHSKKDNRQYQIYVSKPKQPAPPSGYPVIYVLDGNAFFQTFQEAVRVQSVRSEKTGVIPAIIVGIGYPVEENFAAAYRFYDFTLPSSSYFTAKTRWKTMAENRRSECFFDFIQEELKPQINKQFQIDCKRQTIFGHSLGGLFALYVLFTNINAFQTYFISSPSIWWNNQSILEKESAFINELDKVDSEIGVF